MTTYELTTGTREDFNSVQAQMISDFVQQILGAEVCYAFLHKAIGRIISCENPCNNFESLIFTVRFDYYNETRRFGAAAALSCGSLRFTDEAMSELYKAFSVVHNNLKLQLSAAEADARCREKERQVLEKKRKATEKKLAALRASAEKELDGLICNNERKITKTDEFYYTLGWLAKHVGTMTAKMPDYLEPAFIKYFGDVEHITIDSTKVGPAGYTSQWRLSMEASLVKAKDVPATLTDYLNPSGKKVSKTAFVWSLIDDYGFKFGKKQDVVEILRCVPIEYVPIFNEGMKA